MTATAAFANVGSQLDDDQLFGPPLSSGVAPFEAEIDRETGAITNGTLAVPDFVTHIEEPIDADVTVKFEIGEIEGIYVESTGELSASGTAGGTLEADGRQCEVAATAPLQMSTEGSSGGTNPRAGIRFVNGLTGEGAVAGTWEDMTASTDEPADETFCANVQAEIGGEGGIWLYARGDIEPPALPLLTGTDPPSPGASGTPRILGSAEADSTVRVYASAFCTGASVASAPAAQLASPGIAVSVAEGATHAFSAKAIDPAGNVSPCSAAISYTHAKPVSDPPPPNSDDPPPPTRECVVPTVEGKSLRRARRMLRKAGCEVGEVEKAKKRKCKRAGGRKGKGRKCHGKKRRQVVRKSTPKAGSTPADGKVDLKLGYKRFHSGMAAM